MEKLDFSKSSPESLERLSKVQGEIDDFCKAHPKNLTEGEHQELRSLLSERASALTEALGVKVSSLFD